MTLHLMGAGLKGQERAFDQRNRVISFVRFGGSRLNRPQRNPVHSIRDSTPRGRCAMMFPARGTRPRRDSLGGIMRTRIQRLVLSGMLVGGLLVALSTPANAATNQISGVAVLDTTGACPPPPVGYEDFTDFTQVMTGDLDGCWYTNIETTKDNGAPSGVYIESGKEIFVGSLNGGPDGTFSTTYKFESKWDPDVSTGSEVHGRCQHPIVAGSGTGGFEGVTGRLDFKDEVTTGQFFYRGHISFR